MKVYIDKEKGLFLTVQYTNDIKPLLLKMRAYYLSKRWEAFNEKVKAYQEAIFNLELADLGSTKGIVQYEDDKLFQTLFSQKNAQGIKHWWADVTHSVKNMDADKSLIEQTDRRDEFIEWFGIELATEFFDWYVVKYNELVVGCF